MNSTGDGLVNVGGYSQTISDNIRRTHHLTKHLLNKHTNMVSGLGNGSSYTEPISTPIASTISKSTRKLILKGKFLDFALLLSSYNNSSNHFALQVNSGDRLSIVPSKQSRKITSIESWTTTFLKFVAIYTSKYVHETPQLMKYGEIVRDLAIRRPGLAWSYYDCQFRQFRESHTIPWDRLHTEFWVMACTEPAHHPVSRPFRSG